MKGIYNRGDQCNLSHERSAIKGSRHANSTTGTTCIVRENVRACLREFRWKVPKHVSDSEPLGYRLGEFFQQTLELIDGEMEPYKKPSI
jgi:hypothetical protein